MPSEIGQAPPTVAPDRRWWTHVDCVTAPTPGPFDRPPKACIGCGRGDGEWRPVEAAQPPIPTEAVEAARAAIRARWPVQIAPNTAAALARHALAAAAPILLAAGRKQAADAIRAEATSVPNLQIWEADTTTVVDYCARIAEGGESGA